MNTHQIATCCVADLVFPIFGHRSKSKLVWSLQGSIGHPCKKECWHQWFSVKYGYCWICGYVRLWLKKGSPLSQALLSHWDTALGPFISGSWPTTWFSQLDPFLWSGCPKDKTLASPGLPRPVLSSPTVTFSAVPMQSWWHDWMWITGYPNRNQLL